MRNRSETLAFISLLLVVADNAARAAFPTLEDVVAGRAKIIDLAHPLNSKNAYWPGENYSPFKLETIATLERDGVLSKAFSSPEHLGTHIDAPNHFAKNQISVDRIEPADLFGAGVMIDVAARASDNPDFLLTADHVTAWEAKHGRIPAGAVVLVNTGWHRYWKNVARYQNKDPRGQMHFPGLAADAAKLLIEGRSARGIGIDTLSIDYGLARDFVVHKIVNEAGRYGLENLADLDRLPPRGFYLFIAPMKIETGSGGPARVFAILPK